MEPMGAQLEDFQRPATVASYLRGLLTLLVGMAVAGCQRRQGAPVPMAETKDTGDCDVMGIPLPVVMRKSTAKDPSPWTR